MKDHSGRNSKKIRFLLENVRLATKCNTELLSGKDFLINKAIVATRAPAQMSGSKVKSITCCKLYFENKACLKLILLLYNIGAAGCIIHS